MNRILPAIVFSQLFCTSLWFAGNAIIHDLSVDLNLPPTYLAHLTSAIQFGFISGTLVYAVFTISDRFSPSRVFFFSSILAALFNLGITIPGTAAGETILFRFLTGFFLAGIYPVGMKIASDHFQSGLGKSLGFLVGALVVGTAFPHLLKGSITSYPWKYVLYGTSTLTLIGGLIILIFVPDGSNRKSGQRINLVAFLHGFRQREFRAASLGYFGHMWELYTFWAFVPVMLSLFQIKNPDIPVNISLLSFIIIGCGGLACVVSGMLSMNVGAKRLAAIALGGSGICCLLSPLFLLSHSLPVLVTFLFVWGLLVIADSPLFSTLVAQSAPQESRGTSLTIVNCIGFSITIVSIQFINRMMEVIRPEFVYLLLAIGPALGLLAMWWNSRRRVER
jgi:MFS family permease